MPKKYKKKIAICHYRIGGTDGVSLEIAKHKKILEDNGCQVKLIAGNQSNGANYIIKELEWDNDIIPVIKENGFLYYKRQDFDNKTFKEKMKLVADKIYKKLVKIQRKEKFDYILIHNIFSFGGHTAAAKAFYDWINKFKIPCLATHHDFYWENIEYHAPRNKYLKKYMDKYMPPHSPLIEHLVINSLAKKELKKRKRIKALVFPDIFDFDQPAWQKDKYNKNFLKQFGIKPSDIFVLQATRVIPRKGVEIAIDFVKKLQENISKINGRLIYNGKKINERTKVVLVIAGYAENEKYDYLLKIKAKTLDEKINTKFISENIKAERSTKGGNKIYSLWDAYVYADLVTFPSVWEGWGNQFIEAVFAKKPIVAFEYPVFKKDIKKEGYKIISLGSKIEKKDERDLYKIPQKNINKAVKKSIKWLLNKKLKKKLDKNYQIGKKYHDFRFNRQNWLVISFLIFKIIIPSDEIFSVFFA
ncbi:MAG: glycosyltransferase family 4 protein [Patescibacteria group bacterium]